MNFSDIQKQSSIPIKWLIGLFIIILLITGIFGLPVKILGTQLNRLGVEYGEHSGTFWDAQFSDIYIANRLWQNTDVKLKKLPLLLGNVEAEFNMASDNNTLSGKLKTLPNDMINLNSLQGFSSLQINLNGHIFPANITINSSSMLIDKNGLCQQGIINIKTDFLDTMLSKLGLKFPPLEGLGECFSGKIVFSMQSTHEGMIVNFRGELEKEKQAGLITIKLPQDMTENYLVTNELTSYGFTQKNDIWQTTMQIGL